MKTLLLVLVMVSGVGCGDKEITTAGTDATEGSDMATNHLSWGSSQSIPVSIANLTSANLVKRLLADAHVDDATPGQWLVKVVVPSDYASHGPVRVYLDYGQGGISARSLVLTSRDVTFNVPGSQVRVSVAVIGTLLDAGKSYPIGVFITRVDFSVQYPSTTGGAFAAVGLGTTHVSLINPDAPYQLVSARELYISSVSPATDAYSIVFKDAGGTVVSTKIVPAGTYYVPPVRVPDMAASFDIINAVNALLGLYITADQQF